MIAGLETPTDGEIWIGDRCVNDIAPRDRDVAMVFQSALYPHKSVQANIEFPLKARGVPKGSGRTCAEAAAILGLVDFLHRKPGALSGGAATAALRAIVRHPAVFAMDEPLSNLDASCAARRAELINLHQRLEADRLRPTTRSRR